MLQDLPTQIGSIVNQWLSHLTIPFHVCHFWRAFVWLYVCSIGQMSASSLGMAWAPKWWTMSMFDLSSRIWSKFSNKGVNATDNVLVCKWVADRWHGPLWAGYRGSLCSGLIMQILLGQKISELMSSFAHLGSANMASLSQEIIDFEQTLLLFLGPKLPDFLWHSANSCIEKVYLFYFLNAEFDCTAASTITWSSWIVHVRNCFVNMAHFLATHWHSSHLLEASNIVDPWIGRYTPYWW